MQGPQYILKRVYLQRNQQREYNNHLLRLNQITSKSSSELLKQTSNADRLLFEAKQKQEISTQFKTIEKHQNEMYTTQAMMTKLADISEGKYFSVVKQSPSITGSSSLVGVQNDKQNGTQMSQMYKTSVMSLNSTFRKKEDDRITVQNNALAQRMLNLPAVIRSQEQLTHFQQHEDYSARIKQFHVLQKSTSIGAFTKPNFFDVNNQIEEENEKNEDHGNENTNLSTVDLVFSIEDVQLKTLVTQQIEKELFAIEIQAPNHPAIISEPMSIDALQAAKLSDSVTSKDLRKNQILYVTLYQIKDGFKNTIGDAEIDLNGIYQETGDHKIQLDLRSFKELQTSPNFFPQDMRKKGSIRSTLSVKFTAGAENEQRNSNTIAIQQNEQQESTNVEEQNPPGNESS